jgi:hypothetical protein
MAFGLPVFQARAKLRLSSNIFLACSGLYLTENDQNFLKKFDVTQTDV